MNDLPGFTGSYDIVIVGGGIVGLATALALSATPGRRILVLEAEAQAATDNARSSQVSAVSLVF